MAVQVRLESQSVKWIEHAGAAAIAKHEGHLLVLKNNGPNADTLAIYTPGSWHSAVVGDQSARTFGDAGT